MTAIRDSKNTPPAQRIAAAKTALRLREQIELEDRISALEKRLSDCGEGWHDCLEDRYRALLLALAEAAGRMKPNCAGASSVLIITDGEDSKAYFEAAGLLDDLEGSEENDGEGL